MAQIQQRRRRRHAHDPVMYEDKRRIMMEMSTKRMTLGHVSVVQRRVATGWPMMMIHVCMHKKRAVNRLRLGREKTNYLISVFHYGSLLVFVAFV